MENTSKRIVTERVMEVLVNGVTGEGMQMPRNIYTRMYAQRVARSF